MIAQLDLFPAKPKASRARSPVPARTPAERALVRQLEQAVTAKEARYSSAHVRRLMTPLPRITAFD